jgi:hypothetical protein
MTRIAYLGEKMSICPGMYRFNMKVQRDPVVQEVGPFIEFYGNHATVNEETVIYEDEEVFQVYTKKVVNEADKGIYQAEEKEDVYQ